MTNNNEGYPQQLWEKFLKSSLDSFHNYEIIEFLFTIGTQKRLPWKHPLQIFKHSTQWRQHFIRV